MYDVTTFSCRSPPRILMASMVCLLQLKAPWLTLRQAWTSASCLFGLGFSDQLVVRVLILMQFLLLCAVVFGQVVEGMDIVRAIEAVGSSSGKPSQQVTIADAGEMSA